MFLLPSNLDLESHNRKAHKLKSENDRFYKRLIRKPPNDLDEQFDKLHDEVFEKIDCLTCGNCCKTTSPIFYERDIERAAKAVKMKPGSFFEKYLRMDEDKDAVLQQAPCAFLGPDNYCSIYDSRPNACREYPHTNRKKMYQLLSLAFKNTMVCPAVFEITERLKKIIK